MPTSTTPHGTRSATRLWRRLRAAMPSGGGLRDEDWAGRHRLLTRTLIGSTVALTGIAVTHSHLDTAWLVTVAAVSVLTVAALLLPPRRLPSSAVALGFTVVSADLVIMCDGLTEAHFSFFIAVGLLALYRDWVPFITLLIATVVHHWVAGAVMSGMTYDHPNNDSHAPWLWALVHGFAVLLAATTQVIGWRLTEVEERRAGADLTQARAQFGAAFEEAPIAMAVMSPSGVVLRHNPAFGQWLGLTEPLPPGCTVWELPVTPVEPSRMIDRLESGEAEVLRDEIAYRRRTGALIHVDVHMSAIRDDDGRLRLVVAHYMDITEKREHEAELQRKVREDSLTGLLTRGAFEGDLAALLLGGRSPVAVIYMDVDRFKAINDSHGHAVGDHVLRTLGGRLAEIAPPDVLIARLGGDEFAIAVPGQIGRAEVLASAIIRSGRQPIETGGGQIPVTMSVGVSAAVPGEPGEQAMQNADLAMYAAKQGGRDRFRLFDDSMREASLRRVAAEASLREALDAPLSGRLPVWFQPIVSLSTRSVIGAEALVRLRSPSGALMSPADFIPIAEDTGLVVPLGQHVLRTALEQLRVWGPRLPYVSVNVSPRQLSEASFVPMVKRELVRSGLTDPSRLVLEITETSMLHSEGEMRSRLDAVKALGVRLALDDFGTGFSSLTWLQAVPADIVKLDRSFVAGLSTDPDKTSIISAVLWLARALSMSVIAEGVEEEPDAEALARLDCPAAQGYLFSRPVEAAELEALLPPPLSAPPEPRRGGAQSSLSAGSLPITHQAP